MGLRSNWRRRIFLLLLAVVPQLLSLVGLGGLLWVLRIKEVFAADAMCRQAGGHIYLVFSVPLADHQKIALGGVLHCSAGGSAAGADIVARVVAMVPATEATQRVWRVKARVLSASATDLAPLRRATTRQSIRLTVWTRTRRALAVMLAQRSSGGL